jgi:acyl-CoA-binding protein
VVSKRIKEVSHWDVRPPQPGSVWKVVKMKQESWRELSGHLKNAIIAKFKKIFDEVSIFSFHTANSEDSEQNL